jgi:hypothetical protein
VVILEGLGLELVVAEQQVVEGDRIEEMAFQ